MNNNLEYYINKNKHTCIKLPQKVSTCLQINNYLSEYTTDSERQQVLHNLGLDITLAEFNEQLGQLAQQLSGIEVLGNCNIYNAKKAGTLYAIITEIPIKDRALGKLVIFKEDDEWVMYQFIGDNISKWGDVATYRYWKKIDDKSNFGIKLSCDYSKLFSNRNGYVNQTETDIHLTIKSFGNEAYDIKVYAGSNVNVTQLVKNIDHTNNKNAYYVHQGRFMNNVTFKVTAYVNGEFCSETLTIPMYYPMWVGIGESYYGKSSNNIWKFPLRVTDISKPLAPQEFMVYNIEYQTESNHENDGYLYIAIPKKQPDFLKVNAQLSGFDIPLESPEIIDISTGSYASKLPKDYKVYKSKNRFIDGKYDINIQIYQLKVSNQSIEEFNPDLYDDIIVADKIDELDYWKWYNNNIQEGTEQ